MSNKKTSDHHLTPDRVYEFIWSSTGIILKKMFDPCPLHANFDGLQINWKDENYINPPYSLIEEFIIKANEEYQKGKKCYILFPLSKSDQSFFHKFLKRHEKIFFNFRIKFVGAKKPSPQTHCLVIMK